MLLVRMICDPLDLGTYSEHRPAALIPFLREQFPSWPQTARLYRDAIARDTDVTPASMNDLGQLTNDGTYYVVVYPEGPVAIAIAVGVALVALTVAMLLFMPKIPQPNANDQSANNSLGNRVNDARVNARVPDVFGTVRSIPDLLSVPYRVYDDHRQLEIAYMCIGRGKHVVTDIRDGDTLVADIPGASVAVYGPEKSPNNPSDVPDIQVGSAIGDPVFNVFRSNDVNGQALAAPNARNVTSNNDIQFHDGGVITAAAGSGIDFSAFFTVDDELEIGGAVAPLPTGAVLAAAVGAAPNEFTFPSFDPRTKFSVGQFVSVTGAVYTTASAPAGGDISGSTSIPDYPYDPYSPRVLE
jgi:hypothetical protein